MSLNELDLATVTTRLAKGEVTARALTDACLSRIEATPALNSFLFIDRPGAQASADASDLRRTQGKVLSPLDGVPVALKDLLVTRGMPTTAGSKILAGYVPPYDGAMAERFREAGAVIVGKTNLDEFAMGSSNEHSAFGPVKNPWNPKKVAGGSSGGSAAAVAAGQVFGSLGTDTGGSVRQPAALCGVYGLKPTYGRVSRFGVIAYASSLDQVGPFGRSALDLAYLMQTIAGHDPRDSTSANVAVPNYVQSVGSGITNLRIGIPEEYFGPGMNEEVARSVRAGIDTLAGLGAKIVPIRLPHTKFAVATYYIIATAEASSNLARYDGVRYGYRAREGELRRMYAASRFEGFGPEVRRRIILGTYVLSAGYYDAYYGKAQRVRTLLRRDFEDAFGHVDLIATPTSPIPAFDIGERMTDPLTMYLADVFTLSISLSGLPGISIPAGFTHDRLPIGLQLVAPWFEEGRLLAAASAFETVTGHSKERPAHHAE